MLLLAHMTKHYAKTVQRGVRPKEEGNLRETQFGIWKKRGCSDAAFLSGQSCEETKEHNYETNVISIDQENALDRVTGNKFGRQ